MKRILPLIVASFFCASPVQAVPLTWIFSGTTVTLPASQLNGMSVGGLNAEFRIFLDTDLMPFPASLLGNDVNFGGPFQGQVDLETFGVLPVFPISVVENFAPSQGGVRGVELTMPFPAGKTFINFPSVVSADRAHLGPIPPSAPMGMDRIAVGGPDGLILYIKVATFTATTEVPEGGSTALLLTPALVALGFFGRRYRASRCHA